MVPRTCFLNFSLGSIGPLLSELRGVKIRPFPLTWNIAYTTACCYRTSRDIYSCMINVRHKDWILILIPHIYCYHSYHSYQLSVKARPMKQLPFTTAGSCDWRHAEMWPCRRRHSWSKRLPPDSVVNLSKVLSCFEQYNCLIAQDCLSNLLWR